jgi:hypothetical protein
MTGDYFPRLYAWLEADGFAIVSELLHTYPIPDEFNPATGCTARRPRPRRTRSSRSHAARLSKPSWKPRAGSAGLHGRLGVLGGPG